MRPLLRYPFYWSLLIRCKNNRAAKGFEGFVVFKCSKNVVWFSTDNTLCFRVLLDYNAQGFKVKSKLFIYKHICPC